MNGDDYASEGEAERFRVKRVKISENASHFQLTISQSCVQRADRVRETLNGNAKIRKNVERTEKSSYRATNKENGEQKE